MIVDAALRELAALLASAEGPAGRGLGEGSGARRVAALATIARASGSSPRSAGARMLVLPDGSAVGTVGGGLPEARAREAALACLADGGCRVLETDMGGDDARGKPLICGGLVEIWIEPIAAGSPYAAALARLDSGRPLALASSATEGLVAALGERGELAAGEAGRADAKAAATALETGECALSETTGLLYSPLFPADRLLVLGGGHVAAALAPVALGLSFDLTIADPRPEYSSPGRFPEGARCATQAFAEAIEGFPQGDFSYVVVVSPGHLGDLECARLLARREYRYVGMIGSRRKSRMIIDCLVAEGLDREKAESIRSPIGLDIGAETPQEIAVAIAAELVAVRRRASALRQIDEDRRLNRRDPPSA